MLKIARRPGFTLVELLVAVTILSLVLTSFTTIIIRQQRFYASAAQMIETRGSVRQAVDVITSELRGLAPGDSDVYAMGRNFIDYRSSTGSSVLCTTQNAARTTITIPPTTLASQSGLTSWIAPPARGDTVMIYDAGPQPGTADDVWRRYVLTADPTPAASCPIATGFTGTAAEATAGWLLQIDAVPTGGAAPGLTPPTAVGAAIRFFRRARFELYQATDNGWYLGYRDCLQTRATPCNPLQPVSGPYVADNSDGSGGLAFSYRDSTGAVTVNRTLISRIDVIARAMTRDAVRIDGLARGSHRDSLAVSIGVRN